MSSRIIKRFATYVFAGGFLLSVAGVGGCPRQAYDALADSEAMQEEVASTLSTFPGSDRMFNPQPEPPAHTMGW